jgi:hypothetical protein
MAINSTELVCLPHWSNSEGDKAAQFSQWAALLLHLLYMGNVRDAGKINERPQPKGKMLLLRAIEWVS